MQPDPHPVVADPVTDRPAAQDPHVAAALVRYRQSFWTLPGLALVLVVLWLLDLTSTSVVVFALVVLVLPLGWLAPRLLTTPRLARAHSWRPVPARVIGGNQGQFAVAAEGRVLVVSEILGRFGYRVVARTGRLWLIGPGPSGQLLARVDGVTAPLPGKEGTARPGTPPADVAGKPGTAAQDALSLAWAKQLASQARMWIWAVPVLAVLITLPVVSFTAFRTTTPMPLVLALMLTALSLAGAFALAARTRRRFRGYLDLAGLLAAGPWHRAAATLGPWKPGLVGTGDAEATLDGVPVRLLQISRDVVANIEGTGTLWFAGELKPGAVLAVGYPGFPVLGIAVCRPA